MRVWVMYQKKQLAWSQSKPCHWLSDPDSVNTFASVTWRYSYALYNTVGLKELQELTFEKYLFPFFPLLPVLDQSCTFPS